MTHSILIIEDDRNLAELAKLHLEDQGYNVDVVHDGTVGAARAAEGRWALIVLDLMLPGVDGLDICRRVRATGDFTPILMLTARSDEVDRVVGLELGADDYLVKPASLAELVARVRALLRRAEEYSAPAEELIELPGLTIDVARRDVRLEGRPVDLTAREFDLLTHFARHPGRVFKRTELLDQVWGPAYEGYEHTVNTHINRLRAKIGDDTGRHRWIRTVWGVGYKLAEPSAASR
ncbi:MAG: winged helix-turn-helix domain-containing protein [Planctomycetota bacterium]